jgi:ABC-type transporter Mla subunit MlaD
MATQTDTVATLAAVVNQLYDMSGNASVGSSQQQQLLAQAHDLRGDLVALVELQLTASAPGYQNLVQSLNSVTQALNQAEQKIQGMINNISSAADVASAIDGLVQQAVQLGTTLAKFTVA